MKEVFYIKDSTENKISYFHLLFFLIALPFDRFYSTIILASFLVHTLIYISKKKLSLINKTTFILQSVFIVSLISVIYSPSITGSINTISIQLALLLFPFLFSVTSLDLSSYRSRLLEGLTLSATCTVLYLYYDAFRVLRFYHQPLKSLFSWTFVNQNFSLPINMHATYLSMLLVISIIFCFQQLFYFQTTFKRIFFILCSSIQFAGLLQLGSKSAFITILIIIIIGFPWFLVKKIKRQQFLFFSLVFFALLMNFILSFQAFRDRYLETLKVDLHENKTIVEKNGRIDRWHSAMELIKKSPLIGTGTGSEIPLLRTVYFERKMYGPYLASLNAHNQYLSMAINSGAVGLIIYLATIAWGFFRAIKEKDVMLLSFLVLITVVSFSEDLLGVNKGIFIYAFFFPFLILSGRKPDS
jgi:O-antigen ligase